MMGIVNVTPDSFSDGGRLTSVVAAVNHALQLIEDGASIIDIGGESTRPYAEPVDTREELRRVIPVIESLARQTDVPISIDTSKAEVAKEAVAAGAEIINDVSGLEADPKMLDVTLTSQAAICAMHMRGTPQNMQDNPQYADVVEEIYDYLQRRKDWMIEHGISPARICLDPGIGFGKTHEHNLCLIQRIERFHDLGVPILVGHSRKGFIGKITNDDSKERTPGTIAATLHLIRSQVQLVRVHDVRAMQQAWLMEQALTCDRKPPAAS